MKGYSTVDHIPAINHVIEKSAELNKPLHIALIDFEKALDSEDTGRVTAALRDQGVWDIYVGLLEDIYKERTGTITFHNDSENFTIRKGVGQGDSISRKLFYSLLRGCV